MNPDDLPKDQPPLDEAHLPPKVEAEFVNRRTFLIAGGLIIGVIVFVLIASTLLTLLDRSLNPIDEESPLARLTQVAPEPRVLVNEPLTLQRVQETAQANLSEYAWVDQATGRVRIPIDQAMQLLAERGLEATSVPVITTQTASGGDLVQQGADLFQELGCSACHTASDTSAAPTLNGLAGSQVELEGSEVVTADEAYLRQSILDPHSQLVAGYGPIMPANFGDRLDETQLAALIAYIQSLGGQ